ncbi:hypothetical protein SteCoe_6664 [Stentor coeruleus]|uniref:TLDc domain-containing protein n=1 Tax=Stentor coeruleus TaxID=5963 RepID=A0A1R2CPI7_9CILI|nr:hypothetical protein SteCoe_6664 [Stentor coeruleus]
MEEYVVQEDDSWISISLKLDIRLYTLLRLNGKSEESLIYPGMRLKLQAQKKVEIKEQKVMKVDENKGEEGKKLDVVVEEKCLSTEKENELLKTKVQEVDKKENLAENKKNIVDECSQVEDKKQKNIEKKSFIGEKVKKIVGRWKMFKKKPEAEDDKKGTKSEIIRESKNEEEKFFIINQEIMSQSVMTGNSWGNNRMSISEEYEILGRNTIEPPECLEKEIIYCTSEGEVKGKIRLEPQGLYFHPTVKKGRCEVRVIDNIRKCDPDNFRAYIDIINISEAKLLDNSYLKPREHVLILQIIVTAVSRHESSETPMASVFFKILSSFQDFNTRRMDLEKSATEIVDFLKKYLSKAENPDYPLTSIPYYEYLSSYLQAINPQLSEIETGSIMIPFNLPELSIPSVVLTEKMIKEIVSKLPDLYKPRNWEQYFSTEQCGFSLLTFLRITENRGPNILVVKDHKKKVFGAFLPISWKNSKLFYGTGEIFLFNFDQKQKISCFYASLLNECYLASDYEGIIFGGG